MVPMSLKPFVVSGSARLQTLNQSGFTIPSAQSVSGLEDPAPERDPWATLIIWKARILRRLTESYLGFEKKAAVAKAFRESRVCLFLLTR